MHGKVVRYFSSIDNLEQWLAEVSIIKIDRTKSTQVNFYHAIDRLDRYLAGEIPYFWRKRVVNALGLENPHL
jgi:hypothetical protein